MSRRLGLLLRLVSTLSVCSVGPLTFAAEVEFLRVWPAWRNAEAFDRISEYFGGSESTSRNVVLRTQDKTRAGYYFLVRVKSSVALQNARFEVHVIRPDSPEPKVFPFVANVPAKETVFQLGLTGTDWPSGEKANPVAWKLALVTPEGRTIAEHKSFLWEKPAK